MLLKDEVVTLNFCKHCMFETQQECSAPVIRNNIYTPFEGQIQQLLYNGKQWGLWNIRNTSDTIFHGEFQR